MPTHDGDLQFARLWLVIVSCQCAHVADDGSAVNVERFCGELAKCQATGLIETTMWQEEEANDANPGGAALCLWWGGAAAGSQIIGEAQRQRA